MGPSSDQPEPVVPDDKGKRWRTFLSKLNSNVYGPFICRKPLRALYLPTRRLLSRTFLLLKAQTWGMGRNKQGHPTVAIPPLSDEHSTEPSAPSFSSITARSFRPCVIPDAHASINTVQTVNGNADDNEIKYLLHQGYWPNSYAIVGSNSASRLGRLGFPAQRPIVSYVKAGWGKMSR